MGYQARKKPVCTDIFPDFIVNQLVRTFKMVWNSFWISMIKFIHKHFKRNYSFPVYENWRNMYLNFMWKTLNSIRNDFIQLLTQNVWKCKQTYCKVHWPKTCVCISGCKKEKQSKEWKSFFANFGMIFWWSVSMLDAWTEQISLPLSFYGSII